MSKTEKKALPEENLDKVSGGSGYAPFDLTKGKDGKWHIEPVGHGTADNPAAPWNRSHQILGETIYDPFGKIEKKARND